MRLFRGESECQKVCKVTLWYPGIDEKAIFVERLNLTKFARALALMPECFFFNTGMMIQDPGGMNYHVRLQSLIEVQWFTTMTKK